VKHVLVARLDNDGDVLLSGPAVRAVAHTSRVTYLCSPRTVPAASLLPGVDRILALEAPWIASPAPPVHRPALDAFVEEVAELAPDEAVIITSFHQSPLPLALLLRMAGVPVLAAFSEDYPGSLLDVRHRASAEGHEVERALSLVGTLGHHLPSGDDGRLAVVRHPQAEPAGLPDRYVVVHPGASVPARAWSPESNAALVSALVSAGRSVVVTGAPKERELAAYVAGDSPGVIDLSGRCDLAGLAEVLAGAEVLVCGNTGPAHLAAAVGTPVVSIFAPTVPARLWRPWMVPNVLLGDQDIPCAGCRATTCPFPGQPCTGRLTVAEVMAAVDELTGVRLVGPRLHLLPGPGVPA
jgi:ADP-heptose:LPS heptosyltransferase